MQPVDERVGSQEEILRATKDALAAELRVALPGVIQSFDEAAQTVSVQAAIRERVMQDGERKEIEIPLLEDVPVYFPGGQGFDISYPVKEGMDCLVVFADMCIDAWWESGGIQNQTEARRHDLSDGFALVGFRSQQGLAEKYRNDAIVLRAQDTLVEIAEEAVDVTAKDVVIQAQTARINAQAVTLSAGTVNIDGKLVVNGEAYNDHRHTGVEAGASNTGVKA